MTKEQLNTLIIEHFKKENGVIDLTGLDFSGYHLDISGIKADRIRQNNHKANVVEQNHHQAHIVDQYEHNAMYILQYGHSSNAVREGNHTLRWK